MTGWDLPTMRCTMIGLDLDERNAFKNLDGRILTKNIVQMTGTGIQIVLRYLINLDEKMFRFNYTQPHYWHWKVVNDFDE